MIKKISILTTMVLIFGLVINFGYSQAVMIDIVNAGFEEQWLLNNTSTTNESVFGWDFYHPGQIANYGVWNPRVLFEYPGTPTGAPEGRNVGYIQVNGSDATPAGFKQTLDSLFKGYTTYNLEVDIGNTKLFKDLLYEGFPGYRIELWAGKTRLAFDSN